MRGTKDVEVTAHSPIQISAGRARGYCVSFAKRVFFFEEMVIHLF